MATEASRFVFGGSFDRAGGVGEDVIGDAVGFIVGGDAVGDAVGFIVGGVVIGAAVSFNVGGEAIGAAVGFIVGFGMLSRLTAIPGKPALLASLISKPSTLKDISLPLLLNPNILRPVGITLPY